MKIRSIHQSRYSHLSLSLSLLSCRRAIFPISRSRAHCRWWFTSRRKTRGGAGGDCDKNVFVGASARILGRPNNYIPRVAPRRRPSRGVHIPVARSPSSPPLPPAFRGSRRYLAASRLENFDTRGAGRSLARSKLHPLRARSFNTLRCLRRASGRDSASVRGCWSRSLVTFQSAPAELTRNLELMLHSYRRACRGVFRINQRQEGIVGSILSTQRGMISSGQLPEIRRKARLL